MEGGRDIAPIINDLLALPFALRVATKDFHPRDHISFASNHPPPNNKPFESTVTIHNPHNAAETNTSLLWPDHCVQGTSGSELISDLDSFKIQHVIEKGQDPRVEMYSAFAAPFSAPVVASSGLADLLREAAITHVYVAGLAFDYCVKATAMDAAKEGFTTLVIDDATKAADQSKKAYDAVARDLATHAVSIIKLDGKEIDRVRQLK